MSKAEFKREKIQKDTRVLCRFGNSEEYLLTNDKYEEPGFSRVFQADINGIIKAEGRLLGSLAAHQPEIFETAEEMNCTFYDINPEYFDKNTAVDGLVGLAVGDALGVPFEFMSREEVRRPEVKKLIGKRESSELQSFWGNQIPFGAWSDDTSMTVAAISSIIDKHGKIDYDDIMKRFVAWWYEGKYTSIDYPFGLGNNISYALARYRQGTPALDCGGKGFRDNGNGALMRFFPFALYCIYKDYDTDKTLEEIRKAAGITHAHEINVMSCFIYTLFLGECIRTRNPRLAYHNICLGNEQYYRDHFSADTVKAHEIILKNNLGDKSFDTDCIKESGFVINTLAIALYSVLTTGSFEDSVKTAIGFGYDTDTDAAVTGSVAGAIYGMKNIPEEWLKYLKKKSRLIELGTEFEKCCR